MKSVLGIPLGITTISYLSLFKPPCIIFTYSYQGNMMYVSFPLKMLYVWYEWITVFKLAVFIDSGDLYAENIDAFIFSAF